MSQRARPQEQTGQQTCASLILRAEPTVSSILKVWDLRTYMYIWVKLIILVYQI